MAKKKTSKKKTSARAASSAKTKKKTSTRKKSATGSKSGAAKKTKKEKTASAPAARKQGDWAWHELMTSDAGGSEKFYAKILGWKSRKMSMGDGPPYTVFTQNGKDHGGMMKIDPATMPGVPPHWLIYIAVNNVDHSASAAAKSGGSILVPPTDIPGIGRFAIINDPAGATFGIYRSSM